MEEILLICGSKKFVMKQPYMFVLYNLIKK